jgi:23S rRNA pseudouridine1911/1915/1917 synthase
VRTNRENIDVLYEDNHIIVINKRAGDIVQGDKTGDTPLSEIVKEYIKVKYDKPGNVYLGVVHRIDRVTSGAVIFARTDKALTRLNKMLVEKKIDKTYWALVDSSFKWNDLHIENYLLRNPKQNKSYAYDKQVDGSKLAIMNLKKIKSLNNYSLLEIDLETGRHHQIRSQLSNLGYPIKGDVKYGFKRANKDLSISLHARKLEFVHPVKKEKITITAGVPDDELWKACEN